MNALARLAVVGLLVFLPGCTEKPAEPAPPSTPTQADVTPPLYPRCLPENAVDNAVAKLDGIAEELMAQSGIPGMAVAVVHGGKTVYAKGFGVRSQGRATKVDAGHGVPAGVAVQAAGLDGGRPPGRADAIGWDTPIVSKLPWFALSDPAATPMVTSATCTRTAPDFPTTPVTRSRTSATTGATYWNSCAHLPLDPFRISYAYTNFGVTAAAEAVAVGAGKPWEELADDVLYRPARYGVHELRGSPTTRPANRAVGHIQSRAGTSRAMSATRTRRPRRRRGRRSTT